MLSHQEVPNNGDGTFTEASAELGLGISMSSMSATVGDPDADGEEEIFITNQSPEDFYTYPQVGSALFDRDVSGVYSEESEAFGLNLFRWSWSATWVDADLNGWDDLMVATAPFSVIGSGGEVEFMTTIGWFTSEIQSGLEKANLRKTPLNGQATMPLCFAWFEEIWIKMVIRIWLDWGPDNF